MNFKEKLNAVMIEFGLSVSDITRACGVGIPTVNRWLDGKTSPHPTMVDGIFKSLEDIIKAK